MFNWRKAPAPVAISVVTRDICKLRIREWRSDSSLCGIAKKHLENPEVYMLLQVLRNEHLAMIVLPTGAPPEVRAAVQAMSEGYSMCLNNLEAMALHQPLTKELAPTFEPEERTEL